MKKNKMIIYAALACMLTLGGGIATLNMAKAKADVTDATVLDKLVMQEGMSIRANEPEGLRFSATINMTKAAMNEAGIKEVGMVLMPADKVDGALEYNETNGTATALLIPTVEYYEETNTSLSWHSVLVNTGVTGAFPTAFYNTPIMARAYAKYSETEYLYSEDAITKSIGYVATMCQLSGDTGYDSAVVTKIADATAKEIAINGGETLSVDNVDGYQATLTIGGIKVETTEDVTVSWSVSDGDAVTVDGNGKVTAVKGGTATVKATVAYADGSSTEITKTVTVENVQRTVLTQYEWEKYPALNEGVKVANTEDFVIDLAAASTEGEKAISLPTGTYTAKLVTATKELALTNVTVDNNTITLEASELTATRFDSTAQVEWSNYNGGEYSLVVATEGYEVTVSVTLVTKVIKTAEDLTNFHSYTESVADYGVSPWNDSKVIAITQYNGYFKLGANIQLGSTVISHVSTFDYAGKFPNAGFIGTFDGCGYTIFGGNYDVGGLLGYVGEAGVVKNVAFADVVFVYSGDDHWNASEGGSTVIATCFNGTAENVLIDVKDHANSWYAGVFGTSAQLARYKNVVVYYPDRTGSGIDTTGKYFAADSFYGEKATAENFYMFTNEVVDCTSAKKYAYSAKLVDTDIASAGFDTTIWDLSGDKAVFAKSIGETVTVETSYEYLKHTDEGKNTADFTIDLTDAEIKDGKSLEFMNDGVFEAKFGDTLVAVESASATSITIDAAAMEAISGGEYIMELLVNGGEYVLAVPVTLVNKEIDTAEELLNFIHYADNVRDVSWTLYGKTESAKAYDGYFRLIADIDLGTTSVSNDDVWASMYYGGTDSAAGGSDDTLGLTAGLNGVFDGNGYTIKGGVYGVGGLLGMVSENGVVKNVAFVNAKMATGGFAGVVAGAFNGKAQNVLVDVANFDGDAPTSAPFGYSVMNAIFENVVIYVPDDGVTGNGTYMGAIGYVNRNTTCTNVYVFTSTEYVFASGTWYATTSAASYGVSAYSLTTALSATDIATKDFDTTIWNLSGDKAAFVQKQA